MDLMIDLLIIVCICEIINQVEWPSFPSININLDLGHDLWTPYWLSFPMLNRCNSPQCISNLMGNHRDQSDPTCVLLHFQSWDCFNCNWTMLPMSPVDTQWAQFWPWWGSSQHPLVVLTTTPLPLILLTRFAPFLIGIHFLSFQFHPAPHTSTQSIPTLHHQSHFG